MPNIPCASPENLCDDPSRPVTNYSAENPDRERFFGRAYNPTIPPPLGPIFTSTGCVGICTSEVSQEDADQCAARQAEICFNEDNPSTNPDNPAGPSIPTATYFNDEQTGTFTCPDGQVFSYTVPAGTVAKESLAAANASALSMAQNGAINNRICLGDLTPAFACADTSYTGVIDIVCPKSGVEGYTIEVSIVGGALPDGVTLTEDDDNITISGTPTTLGDSTFTIFAQLMLNGGQVSSVLRSYTISVLGIVQSILPEATQGNAYSESFTITGTVVGTPTWALTGGALPAGLTLNTDGTVTGTPTEDGSFNLTVAFTDDNLTCSKDVTLEVAPGVPWDELVWSLVLLEETGTGTAVWTSPGDGGEGSTWEGGTSASIAVGTDRGRLTIDAVLIYAGINRPGRVTITVANNNMIAGPGGTNSSSIQYFVNGGLVDSASMPGAPVPFNGEYTLDFTATAGTLRFRIDMFSSNPDGGQSNPMTLQVSGVIENV